MSIAVIGEGEASEIINEKNHGNRRLDRNRVANYKGDMRDGDWKFNGDPIRFCEKGILIDGQHRLSAMIDSGVKELTFLVVEGIKAQGKKTIDIGKPRTPSDMLAIHHHVKTRDAAAISSAIKTIVLYNNRLSVTSRGGMSLLTIPKIEQFFISNRESLLLSMKFSNTSMINHAGVLSRSECLSLHFILSGINLIEAEIFLTPLMTGAGIVSNSNSYHLRNTLLKRAMKTLKISWTDVFYTCIKAWNKDSVGAVYTGEEGLRFRSSQCGAFPSAR